MSRANESATASNANRVSGVSKASVDTPSGASGLSKLVEHDN